MALSILFYIMMVTVQSRSPLNRESVHPLEETSSYYPSREEALTVLFVGVSRDNREAGTFVLAKFDPARGSVPIVTLPVNTQIMNNGKPETLAQVFRYGGADYTRGALEKTLGITIDRYVRMDETAFLIAATTVGTVEFDLAHSLPLGQDSSALTLNPGTQLLDGQKVAAIIGYQDYDGGELARCEVVSSLTASLVNQRMDIALSAVVDKVFEKIINIIETDISYADYDDRKQAAAFLARLGKDPALPISVAGQAVAGGEAYLLSDTFIASLIQAFS